MSEAILVALIAFVGSLIGNYWANNKNQALIAYRLEQLEKKVNLHNNVIERTYQLEKDIKVIETEIDNIKV